MAEFPALATLVTAAAQLKHQAESELTRLLDLRPAGANSLEADDQLYQDFGLIIMRLTVGADQPSLARAVGEQLLEDTRTYETTHGVLVNKRHLFFGLSLCSINVNDTINAMMYWEQCQAEEHLVAGTAYDPVQSLHQSIARFNSVTGPLTMVVDNNPLYRTVQRGNAFIQAFPAVLQLLPAPELFAYYVAALRYRQITHWIHHGLSEMTRMYAQELINTLCILVEATLKDQGAVETMLGKILNQDLPRLRPGIAAFIGRSGDRTNPATGLFAVYPTRTDGDFNANFPILVADVTTGMLHGNALKAHLLYGTYMLRNKALHDFKHKYIKDEKGNYIQRKPYQQYVRALVTDNPDKEFSKLYIDQLGKLSSGYDIDRLLHGDWDATPKTGGEFYKLFDYDANSAHEVAYDPDLALHISFDFNVNPYMTCTIWQIAGKHARQIDEICLKSPRNTTEAVCREFIARYPGHRAGLFIYGDPSGAKEDTRSEKGHNDYVIIRRVLAAYKPSMRVAAKAPPVVMRGNFINAIFAKAYEGITLTIHRECINSMNDYQYGKEACDGTKLKEKVRDNNTGVSYEKYHHCSDANDYLICQAFAAEFIRYQKAGAGTKIAMGKTTSKNSY